MASRTFELVLCCRFHVEAIVPRGTTRGCHLMTTDVKSCFFFGFGAFYFLVSSSSLPI